MPMLWFQVEGRLSQVTTTFLVGWCSIPFKENSLLFHSIIAVQAQNSFYCFFFGGAVLGLCCCAQAFTSCGERGLLFVGVRGLLIVVASLVVEHGVQALTLQQLWHSGSVVVARGLQSTGSVVVAHSLSCSAACGIFPDQGSNPCPLPWQADS